MSYVICGAAEHRFRWFRHGGSAVAQYLRQELHGLFESVHKSHIPELFMWIQEIGGYFKRFRGGALAPWIHGTERNPEMDLEARATQTFFEVGALLKPFICLAHTLTACQIGTYQLTRMPNNVAQLHRLLFCIL